MATSTPPPEPIPGRWARWVRFLDTREPGVSLALFRIAVGLVVVGAIGSVVLYGLVESIWLGRADGGLLDEPSRNWQFDLLGGPTPATVWGMTLTALVSGALLALGLGGRLTAFVALQSYFAVTGLSPHSCGGDDRLLNNALWLLVLARSTATLSLDCRLRTGRWRSDELIPAWPRYLVIVQLVLLYGSTGLQKIGVDWVPGGGFGAIYYILQEPAWVRWDMSWLAWVFPLTQIATAVTWLFEVSAPLLLLALWFRNTPERTGWFRALFNRINYRRLFVVVGVSLHLSLFVLMNVEPFSWVTLSYYCCLFRPEEWQALGRRLFGSGPTTSEPSPQPGWYAWPHIRAALVSLHLMAVVMMALPGPPDEALDREEWQNRHIQSQLDAWAARLSGPLLEVTPQELEDRLYALASGWVRGRRAILTPFRPYWTYCGTRQSWQMFTAAEYTTSRLHVDVRERGAWRPVHINRDPEYPWLDGWLSHHRLRPVVHSCGRTPEGVESFAGWVAEQAARDFPEAEAVRVRYFRTRTPSPDEMRAGVRPQGEFIHEVEVPLR